VTAPSKVAHQIKHEQNDEDKTESTAATDMAPVGISAAAEEKNENNNKKDECHNDNGARGYYCFAAGEGEAASFSVDAEEGVVTVSVGCTGA
jgi:hypothetical protein